MLRTTLIAVFAAAALASPAAFAQGQKPKASCPFKSAEACFQTCTSRGGQAQYCNRWCVQRMKDC